MAVGNGTHGYDSWLDSDREREEVENGGDNSLDPDNPDFKETCSICGVEVEESERTARMEWMLDHYRNQHSEDERVPGWVDGLQSMLEGWVRAE